MTQKCKLYLASKNIIINLTIKKKNEFRNTKTKTYWAD